VIRFGQIKRILLAAWVAYACVGCDADRSSAATDEAMHLVEVRSAIERHKTRTGDYPDNLEMLINAGTLSKKDAASRIIGNDGAYLIFSYRKPDKENVSKTSIIAWTPTNSSSGDEWINVLRINGVVEPLLAKDAIQQINQASKSP
jgi:hypothetical protein